MSYSPNPFRLTRHIGAILISLGMLCSASGAKAQDVPLISGSTGFQTHSSGGKNTYTPVIAPLLAVPVGSRFLFEGRATILEAFSPDAAKTHRHFAGITYAQGDFIANSHLTVVGGYFLIPFNTYNERLTPYWIGNLQDAPLIYGLGNVGSGSGLGGEIRGNVVAHANYSISYTAYVSAGATNFQVNSSRAAGGRAIVYFPKARLEVGTSYSRILEQPAKLNNLGLHVWWEPANTPLKIRSEYAHGPHSQGYWMESDYRLSQIRGANSVIGRVEPIFRVQQTFRNSPGSDELPNADTTMLDFGLDYHLPREVRIDTSYSRKLVKGGNANVWETGIVYRFLFPTWKGKK